jgi:hypothetical protein
MRYMTIAKNEVSQELIAKRFWNKTVSWRGSARYRCLDGTYLRKGFTELEQMDSVIMPINKCPLCKSQATFHHRIQQTGDKCDNCWDMKYIESEEGLVSIKRDYCLDCNREFIIEMYVFHKVVRFGWIGCVWRILTKGWREEILIDSSE